MQSKKELIIPQGGFTIINKNKTPYTTIVSPGVQCCIVAALNSPNGVALAHVDAAAASTNGAAALKTMITALNRLGTGNITAELIGGDFGDPIIGSSSLHRALVSELKSLKIPYKHNVWTTDPAFALAAISFLLSYLLLKNQKNEVILPFVAMVITWMYFITKFFNHTTYDVYMDIASGKVSTLKSTEAQADIKIREASRNLPEFPRIFERWKKGSGATDAKLIPISGSRIPRLDNTASSNLFLFKSTKDYSPSSDISPKL